MSESGGKETGTYSDYDKRKVESLTDTIKFDRLLKTTEKICFGNNPTYENKGRDNNPEAEIVSKIGLFGLRTALDQAELHWYANDTKDKDFESELDRPIIADTIIRLPERFHDGADPEIIYKAEQFGQLLLEKSFACLGQDAYEKARTISEATSDSKQIDILYWLDNRLGEISDSKNGIEGEDLNDGLYHPLRLSPLAIGQYPNTEIAPTCLGVSILAASFFEKAGMKHLHAGVMEAVLDGEDTKLNEFLLDKIDEGFFPENNTEYIKKIANLLHDRSSNNNGYHVANIVQLQSGDWIQFDSNFGSIGYMENEDVDKKYNDLIDFKDIAPGLALTVHNRQKVSQFIINRVNSIESIDYDYEQLQHALLSSDESIEESIKSIILPPIIEQMCRDMDEDVAEFLKYPIQEAFDICFERLVLWNEPIYEVQERAKADEHFLHRRVEDMQNIWKSVAAISTVTTRDIDVESIARFAHAQLEVGLPARQIGMTVLNDFDTFLNAELSPGFWMNNWASQTPRIDQIAKYTDEYPENYEQFVDNSAKWIHNNNLKYIKSYDIIDSFLRLKGYRNAQDSSQ